MSLRHRSFYLRRQKSCRSKEVCKASRPSVTVSDAETRVESSEHILVGTFKSDTLRVIESLRTDSLSLKAHSVVESK